MTEQIKIKLSIFEPYLLRVKNIYHKFTGLNWQRKFIVLFLIFFPFRFLFGIVSEFWFPDELQVYLIGLKFYSGGYWPYFGPDIVYTDSQIPGALQGLLAGLPFYLLRIPEAPYLLLNILSFLSLFLLGYYIKKHQLTETPEWFLWPWIFSMPWVMNFSTHLLNPSYVLPAAILFFVSFFELIPKTRKDFINPNAAFLFLGISTLWIFQFHMSWILLLPLILIAFFHRLKTGLKKIFLSAVFFLNGCVLSGIFLLPTFIKYGFAAGSGDTVSNIVFNLSNVKEFFTVLSRFLAFGSFEVTLFTGASTASRLEFLNDNLWAALFIVIAVLIGLAMIAWMLAAWFRKNNSEGWKTIKYLLLFVILYTWLSFFFSVKGPSTHTFYLMFPLVMIYSFFCWQPLFKMKWIKVVAVILLFSGIIFHIALGTDNFRKRSMYLDREKPLKAIQQKDYKLLGERRPFDRNE